MCTHDKAEEGIEIVVAERLRRCCCGGNLPVYFSYINGGGGDGGHLSVLFFFLFFFYFLLFPFPHAFVAVSPFCMGRRESRSSRSSSSSFPPEHTKDDGNLISRRAARHIVFSCHVASAVYFFQPADGPSLMATVQSMNPPPR
jgi:hypothetical protein